MAVAAAIQPETRPTDDVHDELGATAWRLRQKWE